MTPTGRSCRPIPTSSSSRTSTSAPSMPTARSRASDQAGQGLHHRLERLARASSTRIEKGIQVAALDQRWPDQAAFGGPACAQFLKNGVILPNTQTLLPVMKDGRRRRPATELDTTILGAISMTTEISGAGRVRRPGPLSSSTCRMTMTSADADPPPTADARPRELLRGRAGDLRHRAAPRRALRRHHRRRLRLHRIKPQLRSTSTSASRCCAP